MNGNLNTKEDSTITRIGNNWIIRLVNRSIVIIIGASLLLIVLLWKQLPPLVPLWYALPWGSDQLASSYWLFILPLGSALMFTINTAFSVYIITDYLVFIQITYLNSLLVSVLSFISLVKILTLVT